VTGQPLASYFAICHVNESNRFCTISMTAKVQIPEVIDVGFLLGRETENISANAGFSKVDTTYEKSDTGDVPVFYSIFLDLANSPPIQRFTKLSYSFKLRAHFA